MNRNAMIAELAVKMNASHILGKAWSEIAASVLDLCGPEPLVWEHDEGVFYTNLGNGRRDCNFDMVTRNHDEPVIVYLGQDEISVDNCWTPAEAKAAAQDHATATHWANTPLGKMVQPKLGAAWQAGYAEGVRDAVALPKRIELLGGQRHAYVRVEEILALIPTPPAEPAQVVSDKVTTTWVQLSIAFYDAMQENLKVTPEGDIEGVATARDAALRAIAGAKP